jgi:hypothetical protein
MFGMSFRGGALKIFMNVAAHPMESWSQRQQQSKENAMS